MEGWLLGFFWFSATMVALVSFGYPLLLLLLTPLLRRPWRREDATPMVSLVIAAYNEERVIREKLHNVLALDYPRDRLEILVASDGSADGTNAIVESFASRGVVLLGFPRTGKTGIQNEAVRRARGDVVVFSDANAMYRPDAIRKLVRNFADPEIGCVCGQLVYRAEGQGAGECEQRYWTYEKFLKQRESELSSLVGANGSIYAVRRADYVELDRDLISDLVEPLALVANGRRVVYEPEAVSVEEGSADYGAEMRRKVRILTRAIGGVLTMRRLFNPFRYGIFSLQLLLHKLARYLVPVFLAIGFLSLAGLALVDHGYRILFLASLSVLCLSWLALARRGERAGDRAGRLARLFHLPHYYLMVNTAVVLAWINILRGRRMTFWAPERKGA
jgi:cellulose synthase/poly-beta-1,6-N-acetylglucosamine synthase-like glycosyltransferase